MLLQNDNVCVEINDKNGATSAIRYAGDNTRMNWILEKPLWGTMPGFSFVELTKTGNSIQAIYASPKQTVRVTVEKAITDTDYLETYIIENIGISEYFLTKDNFGLLMPTNTNYKKGELLMNKCISHIWCGGNVCWMYSARTNGDKPYLVMQLLEGSVEDYSIDYDYSLTDSGVDWRGAFLLHPKACVICPRDNITLRFRFRFSEVAPHIAPLDFDGAMRFTASKYTPQVGEEIKLTLEYNGNLNGAVIRCGEASLPYLTKNGKIECYLRFDSIGERTVYASIDGKDTFLRIAVLENWENILEKRVHFIVENQQYNKAGSHLDGAYLIYDNETDEQYCGNTDHNAGRERIGMGIAVCRALQMKYSEKLMTSLKKHREFVERELFDADSGMVYNTVGCNNDWLRIYNFPWVSVYYLEWYKLTGQQQCLLNATNILLKYYELNGKEQDSQNIEAVDILNALKTEGFDALYSQLYSAFLSHADSILVRNGIYNGEEMTFVNELPNCSCCYLSQAYILTGDDKYLKAAEINHRRSEAFYSFQPDFHLNCITVRYWDDYWFGKIHTYGDVFPHYWSALSGWSLYWYDKARSCAEHQTEINNNLIGNLCIYQPNGMAYNCYLYPYRIQMYSSDPLYQNRYMQTGVTYGKRYDPWANDQDWALYFASTLLKI